MQKSLPRRAMSGEIPSKVPRRHFNPDEDDQLRALAAIDGDQWELIASKMPGRSARQCRERWIHYVSPSISKSAWTPEEDAIIEEKMEKYGNHWKFMEKHLIGRTDAQIKNRYKVIMRRRNKEEKKAVEPPLNNTHNSFGSLWTNCGSDVGFANAESLQCEFD
jgi:hypothetical protein